MSPGECSLAPARHLPLAGRRLLVTAGPTWVRLDAVRHIGNFSTGRTGWTIALMAARAGALVTVLLGPGRVRPARRPGGRVEVLEFVWFDDLHQLVREHVGSRAYDAMVHTAAVSDYRPVEEVTGKLPSGQSELALRLVPTPKIVDEVESLDPEILLVKFKLECGRSRGALLAIAEESRARSRAELIVANDLTGLTPTRHSAAILDAGGVVQEVATTGELGRILVRELSRRLASRPLRTQMPPAVGRDQ